MWMLLLLLAAGFYFGQRWRVDAYRAQRQAARRTDFGRPCVTTDRSDR